jgi:hypothetical protein
MALLRLAITDRDATEPISSKSLASAAPGADEKERTRMAEPAVTEYLRQATRELQESELGWPDRDSEIAYNEALSRIRH